MTVYSIYVCRFNLFLFRFILVIIALPVYSLLQCRSERVISVMFVSIPPPPLSPVWNSQEAVCHGADSICLLSFSDWFFFSLISFPPHSGLLLTGWWWPRRERATAEGAPLARSPALSTQTSVLRRRRPPPPASWPATWSWSRSFSSWTRCPAWRGCGRRRSGERSSWSGGPSTRRRCRARSERRRRKRAAPTASSRSARSTCRSPLAWRSWRHRPGTIRRKVGPSGAEVIYPNTLSTILAMSKSGLLQEIL